MYKNHFSLKKTALCTAILFSVGVSWEPSQAATLGATDNNFTMLRGDDGGRIGGTNAVSATWDFTTNNAITDTNFNMTLASTATFFSYNWGAHHIRVFGPGTYTFDSGCTTAELEAGIASCTVDTGHSHTPLTMTVDAGQFGAHMLFNWNLDTNIDVVNVWDVDSLWPGSPNGEFTLFNWLEAADYCGFAPPAKGTPSPDPSCDPLFSTVWHLASTDDDGDGIMGVPMVDGAFAGSNANFNLRPVPLPAVAWLFASGLLGIIGVARKPSH